MRPGVIRFVAPALLVLATTLLVLLAKGSQAEYRRLHSLAWTSAGPMISSPETFYRRGLALSLSSALGVVASIYLFVRTRRIEWLTAALISLVVVGYAFTQTGVRY